MTPSINEIRTGLKRLTDLATQAADMSDELESQLNNMLELNALLMKRCDLGKAALSSDDIFMINQYPQLAREAIKKKAEQLENVTKGE